MSGEKVEAYVCNASGAKLELAQVELRPLGPEDVHIEVEHCGLCFTDLAKIDDSWHGAEYPMVAGHEAVGKVVAVGSAVKNRTVGQYVGVGALCKQCNACDQCLTGTANYCEGREFTFIRTNGGFTRKMHCTAAAAVPIPAGIDPRVAGPLMCGGATVWAPIQDFVKPTDHVGVVGIGGLGHLALQFLRAWGCHVTAFTRTASKTEEAKKHGAHATVVTSDQAAVAAAAKTLDFILLTSSGDEIPITDFIATLKPRGRLHLVGVPSQLNVDAKSLIFQGLQVSATFVASPTQIEDMLEFAARHNIAPQCEFFKFSEINDALDKLRKGAMRYRGVLSW